ncbi:HNH endonuclease [Tropicibacter naphthalenivorans]|uniref:Putative restriction endonuclease n=1 Tax=Tropicibacter naphthalenivorans TaxID=441103 RepID=A0A0P1G302_9RHOB|nr:HNH endonuclease [Tropicibacter naphthalenivorans]CUH76208.1 putative restriction endonuclease [Tropicibacter naphthalenivorans]SMC39391.1 HNH endonuclease [Tropicibacter naphthalenivorans]
MPELSIKIVKEAAERFLDAPHSAERLKNNINLTALLADGRFKIAPTGWILSEINYPGSAAKRSNHSVPTVARNNFEAKLRKLGFTRVSESDPAFQSLVDQWSEAAEPGERKIYPVFLVAPNIVESDENVAFPSEIESLPDKEGSAVQITTNRYERNPALRTACIKHWRSKHHGSLNCASCGFDFEKTYGPLGEDFIHIHHLDPLGNGQEERLVDPTKDLIPLCPNCHAMAHRNLRMDEPPRTADELSNIRKARE